MDTWHFQEENELVSPQLVVNRTLLIQNIEHAVRMIQYKQISFYKGGIMDTWHFQEENELVSPQLVVNRTLLIQNIEHAVRMAGDANHLWPHVKTHKTGHIVRLMAKQGIVRFKCATISEAEMAASFGGKHIILAYPLVGPNIPRFLQLIQAFPDVVFYAVGDTLNCLESLNQAAEHAGIQAYPLVGPNIPRFLQLIQAFPDVVFYAVGDTLNCLESLNQAAEHAGIQIPVLIDVNMGMDRTGVPVSQLEIFYKKASAFPFLRLCGLHCYDGHHTETDFCKRKEAAKPLFQEITRIRSQLNQDHFSCSILVMGGTPSFPCYTSSDLPDLYFSPGTLFLNDYGYASKYPDLKFDIAAAVLTRVVSRPAPGHFTLDLGYKGIASDPDGVRGVLADFPHAHPLFQSEEHWAFAMDEGFEEHCPDIGDVLYIIPTHICPTSALYSHMAVIEEHKLAAWWEVHARNRKITY